MRFWAHGVRLRWGPLLLCVGGCQSLFGIDKGDLPAQDAPGGSGGAGGAGAGGQGSGPPKAGSGGAGGGGGAGGPPANSLGCTPWRPDTSPQWGFRGDTRLDGDRFVLTPEGGSVHWGQAYFSLDAAITTEVEIVFTFTFESGAEGGDDHGIALWFSPEGGFGSGAPASEAEACLGVPEASAGAVLGLDLSPKLGDGFWGLYGDALVNGRGLSDDIEAELPLERAEVTGTPALASGAHAAKFRLTVAAPNELELGATFLTEGGLPEISATLQEGKPLLVNGGDGTLGVSAGSTPDGAVFALLGVEVKVDGDCFEPPPLCAPFAPGPRYAKGRGKSKSPVNEKPTMT